MQRFIRILSTLFLVLIILSPAIPIAAQTSDWRERLTLYFAIVYTPADAAEAERYAGFVDAIYEEVATIFSHQVNTPITLRLYPTTESYYEVNPGARSMGGIVAHADFLHNEVVIIIEQTRLQAPDEIPNNVRHELTHIFAADLSGNRLNVGFQEGIAQYAERSAPDILLQKAQLVHRAREEGRLISWGDLDERDKIYADPSAGYPQTLSIVAFLIERFSFEKFRAFLSISGRSSGYRSALERAYALAPAALEKQWLAWLPSYIEGGYRLNAITSYNLDYPERLIAQGRYSEAQTELEQALTWMRSGTSGQPPETVVRAEALLTKSREGQRAERMAATARTALERGNYDDAAALIAQARTIYTALGDTRQTEVLATYDSYVARGLSARHQLERAGELARALNLPQARSEADLAATEFASLGDTNQLNNAIALRNALDYRQRLAGFLLVGIGVISILFSFVTRRSSYPEEAW